MNELRGHPPSGHHFCFHPTGLQLRDGRSITVRSITREDEPLMIRFHQDLSEESVHFRYFGMLSLGFRTGHARLAALCSTDPAREIALVAKGKMSDGESEILGVGRLIRTPDGDEAEFAILVTDRWQGGGLGTALLRMLVETGRKAGVCMFAHILPDNSSMLHICRKAGFDLHQHLGVGEWKAVLDMRPEELKHTSHALA